MTLPLLFNLAIAAVLRAAIPYTIAEGGERYRYYLMHAFFPIRDCGAFHCFRILPPMLASVLPLGTLDAFLVSGALFHAGAATALWLVAEHLHHSRRVAAIASCAYWLTWGALQSLADPLLVADPVQAFWSISALYLLLTGRRAAALPWLVAGAAVKESVLLVPAIHALYTWLGSPRTLRLAVRHLLLVAAPAAAWLALRLALHTWFGYATSDAAYLTRFSLLREWIPGLGPAPWAAVLAAAQIYGSFGAFWIFAAFGLRAGDRADRALTLASAPAMIFLSLYQSPERALPVFPYAVLIPAAAYLRRLPAPAIAAVLFSNAALLVALRRGASFWWLPRGPAIAVGFAVLAAALSWAERLGRRGRGSAAVAPVAARGGRLPLPGPSRARRATRERAIVAVCTAAALLVAAMVGSRIAAAGSIVTWAPEPGVMPALADDEGGVPSVAASPDGSRIAFVAVSDGVRSLWLRPIDGAPARRLAGTEQASEPFWSADGAELAFFAGGTLNAASLESGRVRTIAAAPAPRGGAWGAKGDIIYAPDARGGLFRVPPGGAPVPLTTVDPARGEVGHAWPAFMPDGDRFLFLALGRSSAETGLQAGSIAVGTRTPIADRADPPAHAIFNAVYAPPGLLFFARPDGVWVQPFDGRRMTALASRVQFTDAVATGSAGRGAFAVGGGAIVFAVRENNGAVRIAARRGGLLVDRLPPALYLR
ncbi:MAG: hypothetical protein IT176_12255 [Acidobacteria bacterium]|nr:hypothetical protein [Acidobacteriota bacterium]